MTSPTSGRNEAASDVGNIFADVGHLRIFGSTAWVHVPKETRQKLDPKSVKCVLVGYEEDAGWRIYKL